MTGRTHRMSESDANPVKPITVVLAALTIGLAAMVALARQDAPADAKPQAGQSADPSDAPVPEGQPDAQQTQPAPDTQPQTGPTDESSPDAPYQEPVLAERLYELAQSRLREQNVTEPMWRQAAALLQAAARLSPRDPPFPRMLIEARLKVGDRDGAIAALNGYRKVDPGDRVAQIQLIDLYAERMQTADARLEYLRDVLARETIPDDVRSHVAGVCVPLLMERSQDEAAAMVEEALRLWPLNPTALRLKYELMPPDANAASRAEVLLAMLRSNPAQPNVVNELAGLMASTGMGKEALEWYSVALRLYPRAGLPFPEGFVADAGAQLLMSNQSQSLDALLSAYLQARPDDADGWFLRLAKEKSTADKVDRKLIEGAWNALAVDLGGGGRDVNGADAPAGAAPPGPAAPSRPPGPPPKGPPARPPRPRGPGRGGAGPGPAGPGPPRRADVGARRQARHRRRRDGRRQARQGRRGLRPSAGAGRGVIGPGVAGGVL